MLRARVAIGFTVLVLFLISCFGPRTTRTTRLFVLHATVDSSTAIDRASELRLGVGRITLPEILNRPQIVTRVSDNEVRVADFSQWAEPLEKSVPRVIAENLARLLRTDRVSVYPWPTQMGIDLRVEGAIAQLEGNVDGAVSLVARWRLLHADGSEALPLQRSSHSQMATDASVDAMVGAMSRILEMLSRDIAAAIEKASR